MKSVTFVHVRNFIDLTSPVLLFLSFFLSFFFFFFFLAFKFSYIKQFDQELGSIKWVSLSHVLLFVTPWTIIHQAPVSLELSRQEHKIPSPGVLPDPGIEPGSPALQADSLPSKPPGKPLKILSARNNLSSTSELLKLYHVIYLINMYNLDLCPKRKI